MRRLAAALFTLASLALAAPAAAQSTSTTVTASVNVVEPFNVSAGPSTVAAGAEWLDVTTPLAVRGKGRFVTEATHGGASVSGASPALRIAREEGRQEEQVTYTISLIN